MDSYREDLVQTLFKISNNHDYSISSKLIPAIGLSKYLSSPLVSLEKRVEKLANHEWNEPVELKGG